MATHGESPQSDGRDRPSEVTNVSAKPAARLYEEVHQWRAQNGLVFGLPGLTVRDANLFDGDPAPFQLVDHEKDQKVTGRTQESIKIEADAWAASIKDGDTPFILRDLLSRPELTAADLQRIIAETNKNLRESGSKLNLVGGLDKDGNVWLNVFDGAKLVEKIPRDGFTLSEELQVRDLEAGLQGHPPDSFVLKMLFGSVPPDQLDKIVAAINSDFEAEGFNQRVEVRTNPDTGKRSIVVVSLGENGTNEDFYSVPLPDSN